MRASVFVVSSLLLAGLAGCMTLAIYDRTCYHLDPKKVEQESRGSNKPPRFIVMDRPHLRMPAEGLMLGHDSTFGVEFRNTDCRTILFYGWGCDALDIRIGTYPLSVRDYRGNATFNGIWWPLPSGGIGPGLSAIQPGETCKMSMRWNGSFEVLTHRFTPGPWVRETHWMKPGVWPVGYGFEGSKYLPWRQTNLTIVDDPMKPHRQVLAPGSCSLISPWEAHAKVQATLSVHPPIARLGENVEIRVDYTIEADPGCYLYDSAPYVLAKGGGREHEFQPAEPCVRNRVPTTILLELTKEKVYGRLSWVWDGSAGEGECEEAAKAGEARVQFHLRGLGEWYGRDDVAANATITWLDPLPIPL